FEWPAARNVRTINRRSADRESIGAGGADGRDALGAVNRAGDHDEPSVAEPSPAGGDEVERVGLRRPIGEDVDAGAAQGRESSAVRLHLLRSAAELGWVA